jgi:hypothetical protein
MVVQIGCCTKHLHLLRLDFFVFLQLDANSYTVVVYVAKVILDVATHYPMSMDVRALAWSQKKLYSTLFGWIPVPPNILLGYSHIARQNLFFE